MGANRFTEAFGENDQPWDRWSPPVFDDDDFLAYLRRLGVKSQKYAREIVFKMQDRTTRGNSCGGWTAQENGEPFPLEAQYSYYLAKKSIQTLEGLVEDQQIGILSICNWTSLILTNRFQYRQVSNSANANSGIYWAYPKPIS